jgi:formylglycine-generating enzyme required for sulfatase activity
MEYRSGSGIIKLTIILMTLVTFIAGCVSQPAPEAVKEPERTTGDLLISLFKDGQQITAGAPGARDVTAEPFQAIQYSYTLDGPEGIQIVRNNVGIVPATERDVTKGSWQIAVTGFDEMSVAVSEGSASVVLEGGAVARLNVDMLKLPDDRNFLFSVSWPSGIVLEPRLSFSLMRLSAGKLEAVKTAEQMILNGTKALYGGELDPGHYFVVTTLFDGTIARAWLQENVQILSGESTFLAKSLRAADIASAPAAVADLAVEARSDDSVFLSWRDMSENEQGFQVFRRVQGEFAWEQIANLEANVRSYVDKGIRALTRYEYQVQVFNEYGKNSSPIVNVRTPTWDNGTAKAITPGDGERVINSKPVFTWERIDRAVAYELEFSATPDFNTITKATGRIEGERYVEDTMLRRDRPYYWRFRGINKDGTPGEWTAVFSFRIELLARIELETDPPLKAKVEGETPKILQGQVISATASTSDQVDRYAWFLNGTMLPADTQSMKMAEHLDPGQYTLSVLASSGQSIATGSTGFGILSELHLVSRKPLKDGVLHYVNRRIISWDPIPTAVEYQIHILDVAEYERLVEEGIGLSTPQYEIRTTLVDGRQYRYRVRATDSSGKWSAWSAPVSFSTKTIGMPVLTKPAAGAVLFDRNPEFGWSAVDGAVKYEIRLTDREAFPIHHTVTGLEFKTDRRLSIGRYDVVVRALMETAEAGPWSSPRTFTVGPMPSPGLVLPASNAVITVLRPQFSWEAFTGMVEYRFQLTRAEMDFGDDVISLRETAYIPPNELDYGNYKWRVRGLSTFGDTSAYSTERYFQIVVPAPLVEPLVESTDLRPRLGWSAVPNVEEYEVQIIPGGLEFPGEGLAPYPQRIMATEYMPAEDLHYGTWNWRVRGISRGGRVGTWSNEAGLVISMPAPQVYAPVDGFSSSNNAPRFSWKGLPGIAEYQLRLEPANPEQEIQTFRISGSPQFSVSSALAPGGYGWSVRGIISGGEPGPFSDIARFDVLATSVPLVQVNGGEFSMGSRRGDADELPIHSVWVSSFEIGTRLVTQAEYLAVMESNPSLFSGKPNAPVEGVSWFDAIEFCNRLSDLEGLDRCYTIVDAVVVCDWTANGYRLPTEAEWEYAANGGDRAQGKAYAGSDDVMSVAWFVRNSEGSTQAVGTKAPNEIGAYDFLGNVWEWCWDWFGPYTADYEIDPVGPESGTVKAIRGGSWESVVASLRIANRNMLDPAQNNQRTGFRIVRRLQ